MKSLCYLRGATNRWCASTKLLKNLRRKTMALSKEFEAHASHDGSFRDCAPRHFDAHAYRTEDIDGVKDFARGCMRTYVILEEKARQWNEDPEIQAIVKELNAGNARSLGNYSSAAAQKLLATSFDRHALAQKGLQYERLDQIGRASCR